VVFIFGTARRVIPAVWTAAALALGVTVSCSIASQPRVRATGVHLDDAFQLVGSDSSGLVISVTINALAPKMTTDDFAAVAYDDKARRTGEVATLALRFLDGADPKPPWVLLDGPQGTLSRSYRALIDSHAAVVETTRKKSIEKVGRYEFVYLVGQSVRQAALVYDQDVVHRPDPNRVPVAKFTVPWP